MRDMMTRDELLAAARQYLTTANWAFFMGDRARGWHSLATARALRIRAAHLA